MEKKTIILALVITVLIIGISGTIGMFAGIYFGTVAGYSNGVEDGLTYYECLFENDPDPYAEEFSDKLMQDCSLKYIDQQWYAYE